MNRDLYSAFEQQVGGTEPTDSFNARPVLQRDVIHEGIVWDVVAETADLGHSQIRREFIDHPSAVAVIATRIEAGVEQVLLLRQYRHPVRADLWEPPAGILDVAGEDLQQAAARELAEEADLAAATWDVLVDYFTSPGCCDEGIRIFWATDVTHTGETFDRSDEEADIEVGWFPLDDVVRAILAGKLHNPSTVVGVLALAARRARA